jgi:hypothetical protein
MAVSEAASRTLLFRGPCANKPTSAGSHGVKTTEKSRKRRKKVSFFQKTG